MTLQHAIADAETDRLDTRVGLVRFVQKGAVGVGGELAVQGGKPDQHESVVVDIDRSPQQIGGPQGEWRAVDAVGDCYRRAGLHRAVVDRPDGNCDSLLDYTAAAVIDQDGESIGAIGVGARPVRDGAVGLVKDSDALGWTGIGLEKEAQCVTVRVGGADGDDGGPGILIGRDRPRSRRLRRLVDLEDFRFFLTRIGDGPIGEVRVAGQGDVEDCVVKATVPSMKPASRAACSAAARTAGSRPASETTCRGKSRSV